MATHTFFPTLIHQSPIGAPGVRRSLCRDLLKESLIIRDIDEDGNIWSEKNYTNGYTSYGSWDTLHERFPAFTELERRLRPHVRGFARRQHWDLGQGSLHMVSCWVNIMPPNTVHSLHLHPLAVVSGTFYVSIPQGTSPIKFEDPRLDRYMAQPPRLPKTPRAQQPFVTLDPKEGDVILFESWLRHEVPQTPAPKRASKKSAEERISVSFNYDWR